MARCQNDPERESEGERAKHTKRTDKDKENSINKGTKIAKEREEMGSGFFNFKICLPLHIS